MSEYRGREGGRKRERALENNSGTKSPCKTKRLFPRQSSPVQLTNDNKKEAGFQTAFFWRGAAKSAGVFTAGAASVHSNEAQKAL